MGAKNRSKELDDYANKIIKRKAKQLIGHYGFTESDREDIQQELSIHVWRHLPKYDPSRASRRTFMARIIENYIKSLIAGRKAACRDYKKTIFLEDLGQLPDRTRSPRGNRFDQDAYLAASRGTNDMDLAIAIHRVLERLPDEYRDLCLAFTELNESEVAETTGKPRSTIYEIRKRIKAILEAHGLREYL